MRAAATLAVLALALASLGANCQTIHPATGPNTSYPCGVWGVECPGRTCCPYRHVCGGNRGMFTTCPPGMCCYTGEDDWPHIGARKP